MTNIKIALNSPGKRLSSSSRCNEFIPVVPTWREVVEANGGNHKTFETWKNEYGCEMVEG